MIFFERNTNRAEARPSLPLLKAAFESPITIWPDTCKPPGNTNALNSSHQTGAMAGTMGFEPLFEVKGPTQVVLGVV
jgi:hypothetical protein